jgi:hypothetical protein
MPSYIPLSDELLFQDPEQIDDYHGWQQFTDYLKREDTIRDNKPLALEPNFEQLRLFT